MERRRGPDDKVWLCSKSRGVEVKCGGISDAEYGNGLEMDRREGPRLCELPFADKRLEISETRSVLRSPPELWGSS